MPIHRQATSLAQGYRVRRQNHSCDQCRKSKRACDALPDLIRPESLGNSVCSYCTKTKKRCTMEWARSQAQSALGLPYQSPHSERSQESLFLKIADALQVNDELGNRDNSLQPNFIQKPLALEPTSVDQPGSLFDYDSTLLRFMFNSEIPEENNQSSISGPVASAQFRHDILLSESSDASNPSTYQPLYSDLDTTSFQSWPVSQNLQNSFSFQSSSPEISQRLSDSWKSYSQQSAASWNSPQPSLSLFSIDQKITSVTNSNLTSANLLQIYHDVLEHNLSCWLTEMTCPYQRSKDVTHAPTEWGKSWSNRIYQRTVKLDRVAQSCKLLQLTHSEDQAASKALHLAIMAFATQWAQGSHRHREKIPGTCLQPEEDELSNGINNEFDIVLQHHFWDQAQCTLQQVANVESFRVAFAEIIFGLTQKPWSSRAQFPGQEVEAENFKSDTDSILSRLGDIICKEGPPVYMERAVRKMHALKFRCDSLEKGFGNSYGSRYKGRIPNIPPEDQETIGLLYWLAIMFDTVSSSMNERPLVVLDHDCESYKQQKRAQKALNVTEYPSQSQWDLELFIQRSPDDIHQTHWPCSYDAAAKDIINSAPIKILLFRHLSYLQNVVRKRAPQRQVEEIIRSMASLYEYWNNTHGAFFRELVENYSAVPQRIQGWFVCISAHWHLAALMIADLLEFIDENALGMEDAAHERVTRQMTRRIKKQSAGELSDLARVGIPPSRYAKLRAPQISDFHHAVNEGTLLTEPWTMILIKAFTKASMTFLAEANEILQTELGQNSHDFERNVEQAEYCMKGLWLLGKKSGMA